MSMSKVTSKQDAAILFEAIQAGGPGMERKRDSSLCAVKAMGPLMRMPYFTSQPLKGRHFAVISETIGELLNFLKS